MAWVILWFIILIVMFIQARIRGKEEIPFELACLVLLAILFIATFYLGGWIFEEIGFEVEDVLVNEQTLLSIDDDENFLMLTQKDGDGSHWEIAFVYKETTNGLHVNQEIYADISDFQVIMDNDTEPRILTTEHRWKNSSVGFWFAHCPNGEKHYPHSEKHYTFYIPNDSVKYMDIDFSGGFVLEE